MPWFFGMGSASAMPWLSFLPLILIWSFIWKGLALWFAARREEKIWFVIFLLVNTVGILELVYLIFVAKVLFQSKKETKRKK